MIARVWRGVTPEAKAETYREYLDATGGRACRETPGNRGVLILRRESQGRAEFTFVSFWDSWDAIRRFAGEDPKRTVYFPEDDDYLIEKSDVTHHEVVVGLEAS